MVGQHSDRHEHCRKCSARVSATIRVRQKKGEAERLPLLTELSEIRLERIPPVEHHVDPVAAFARTAIRSISAIDLVAESEVIAGLAHPVTQVSRVVPQDIGSNAHAWRDEVPQIPLS